MRTFTLFVLALTFSIITSADNLSGKERKALKKASRMADKDRFMTAQNILDPLYHASPDKLEIWNAYISYKIKTCDQWIAAANGKLNPKVESNVFYYLGEIVGMLWGNWEKAAEIPGYCGYVESAMKIGETVNMPREDETPLQIVKELNCK